MATHKTTQSQRKIGAVCHPSFARDFQTRRIIEVELPEFLIYALEQRVIEANDGAPPDEISTLDQYIESELANLITVRDVAELDAAAPGFAIAIQRWLKEIAI
jgi:hypothetical protein